MDSFFKLDPVDFTECCPACGEKLTLKDFKFFGWRFLFDSDCKGCSSKFLIDMPIFSGIPYPAFYDQDVRLVVNQVPKWWSAPLCDIQNRIKSARVVKNISHTRRRDKAIIFNTLDFVFGHSFMRLEILTGYLDNERYDDFDFIVLLPTQLRYLLDRYEQVISIIEIDLPFRDYTYFYTDIDVTVKSIFNEYRDVFCEHLRYPQQEYIDLTRLNLPISKFVASVNKVVISYRTDRTIGITRRSQFKFYKKLINRLKKAGVEVSVIGDKDDFLFSGVKDLRESSINKQVDNTWSNECSGAIVVGVHGSNMLIPSLCSSYCIEIVSSDKLFNFGQASSFYNEMNQQETIQKYRYIYGNRHLSDINPDIVFEVIFSIFLQMNIVFEAVRSEKTSRLFDVRKKYELANRVNRRVNLYIKIEMILVRIRKSLNL